MLETKIKITLSTIPVGLLGALLILMVQSAPVPAVAQSGQETFFEEAVREAARSSKTRQQRHQQLQQPAAPAAQALNRQQQQQTQDYDANLTGSMQVPPAQLTLPG